MSTNWKKVKTVFEELADLSPQEREARWRQIDPDAKLTQEVERLLRVFDEKDTGLEPIDENDDGTERPVPLTRVGNYELVRELGQGGMGHVYLGRREGVNGFEKFFAIKCLSPKASREPSQRKFLENEAKALSQLNHPNVIQVFEFIFQDGRYFIVSEFLEGKTLRELNSFSVPDALLVISDICDALKHIHQAGLIHRDVTPQNIMLTGTGTPKLFDFGIANAVDAWGTPGYIAPEILQRNEPEPASDLYSLTLVFCDMVFGVRESDEGLGAQRVKDLATATLSEEIKSFVRRGLSVDPKKRFSDAGTMGEAVAHLISLQAGKGSQRHRLAERVGKIAPPKSEGAIVLSFPDGGRRQSGPVELQDPIETFMREKPVKERRSLRLKISPRAIALLLVLAFASYAKWGMKLSQHVNVSRVRNREVFQIGIGDSLCTVDILTIPKMTSLSIDGTDVLAGSPVRVLLPCERSHVISVMRSGFQPAMEIIPAGTRGKIILPLVYGEASFSQNVLFTLRHLWETFKMQFR